jgi:hypothetical protein
MSASNQTKIDRISIAISLISVVIGWGCWQQSVGANVKNRSNESLELQPIQADDVTIDGASCNFVDKQQRTLLTVANGTTAGWVKIAGRMVKIHSTESSMLSAYRSETLTIDLDLDRGIRHNEGITIYRHSNLKLTYNGRQLSIPVTGYCTC